MLFSPELQQRASKLVAKATKSGLKIATAESCTGGLLAGLITDISGASKMFECGIVTYSNRAKIEQLTVPSYFIEEFGAVSRETAIAMAEGLLLISRADLAVSITGVAGPDGGTAEKPVGTVFMALASRTRATSDKLYTFSGNREQIRLLAVEAALELLLQPFATKKP